MKKEKYTFKDEVDALAYVAAIRQSVVVLSGVRKTIVGQYEVEITYSKEEEYVPYFVKGVALGIHQLSEFIPSGGE